jgi:hypothetical protein
MVYIMRYLKVRYETAAPLAIFSIVGELALDFEGNTCHTDHAQEPVNQPIMR